MRGVISYVLAGLVVVLAMDLLLPPTVLGGGVFAWPVTNEDAIVQIVNRAQKADRLHVPAAIGRRMTPPNAPAMAMPIGCESVFSSLSAGAQANFPGRCIA